MKDRFSDHSTGLTSPAEDAVAITPDDEADLGQAPRALYVGGSGSLRAVLVSGNTVDFTDLKAGMVYPFRLRRILASGTTATGLVGLY